MKLAFALTMILLAAVASAQITPSISVSGRLTAAGTGLPISGDREITFAIYDAADNSLFTVTKTVTVSEGLFSTTIEPSLPFNKDYFLQLGVDGETLNPKQKITPAPYAIYANRAGELGSGVVTVAGSNVGIGLGTTAPSAKLEIFESATGTSAPTLYVHDLTNAPSSKTSLLVSINTDNPGNYVARFLGDNGAIEALAIGAEGNVGINNANPSEKLDVSGNVKASGTITAGDTIVLDGNAGVISSLQPLRLASAGDVEIDASNDNSAKAVFKSDGSLVVSGTVESTDIKIGGGRIRYFSGSSPECPAGSGMLSRNWAARTCSGNCGSCTTSAGWSGIAPTCFYPSGSFCAGSTLCTANAWPEALCIGG